MRLVVIVVVIMAWSAAWATVYEWTDRRGVVNMTDDPDKVPSAYRKTMKTRDIDTREAMPSPAAPVGETVGTPLPPPKQAKLYGGHDEEWWRNSFQELRQKLQSLRADIADKKDSLAALHRRRVIYQRPEDRVAYFAASDEVTKDEEKAASLQKRLDDLDREAEGAGVPREWRQ